MAVSLVITVADNQQARRCLSVLADQGVPALVLVGPDDPAPRPLWFSAVPQHDPRCLTADQIRAKIDSAQA